MYQVDGVVAGVVVDRDRLEVLDLDCDERLCDERLAFVPVSTGGAREAKS